MLNPLDPMVRFCGTALLHSLVDTVKELLARPNTTWAIARSEEMAPDIPINALALIDTSRREITPGDIFGVDVGDQ